MFLLSINLSYSQNQSWANYTCSYKIYDMQAVDNKLWVATIGGCATIDQTTGLVKQYNSANTGLPDIFVRDMSKSNNGDLWFDVYLHGISKYDGNTWTNYTQNNSGIPDNNIAYVKENINGEVWMLSYNLNSLINFDGTNWTTYNSSNTNLPNKLGQFVFDNNGDLWIATLSGLVHFDGVNAIVYNTLNSNIPTDSIVDIKMDNTGNIWMTSYQHNNKGLIKFDGQTWIDYTTNNSSIPSNEILSITLHDNKVYGVYSTAYQHNGVFMFNGSSWVLYNSTNTSLPQNVSGTIGIQFTSNGDMWMLAGEWPDCQVIQFNGSTTTYHDITNSPLKGNAVLDLDFDSNGKLLIADPGQIAYQGGVISYKDNIWKQFPQQTGVDWITIQNDSVIWMGMYNRLGKLVYDGTTQSTQIYTKSNSGLPSNTVLDAVVDSSGNMWFATANGVSKYDGNNWIVYDTSNSILPYCWLKSIIVDSNNNIWVGSDCAGVYMFNGMNWTVYNTSNSGIGSNLINKIIFDRQGNLWVATGNNGVSKFDGTNWIVYNSSNAVLPYDNALGIGFDNQNNLWVGTWNGASYFDGLNWTLYNTENSGISANDVYDFAFDDEENVWIGTGNGGISVYNPNGVTLSTIENKFNKEGDYECKVFPIPFGNNFTVNIPKEIIGSTLFLYDLNGHELDSYILNNQTNTIDPPININGLFIYVIINNGSFVSSGKIFKKN